MARPNVVLLSAAALCVWTLASPRCPGEPSSVERFGDQVVLVRDDAGNWGGGVHGITHQCGPGYWARKRLDLSRVDEAFWTKVSRVQLSAFFCVRDYSRHASGKANGLDEHFEVVVNDHVHRFATKEGFPVYKEGRSLGLSMRWHDFDLPKAELVRGPNEIIFRKATPPGGKVDDYLYLGIDNTVAGGSSWVRFSAGGTWRQDKLTVPGGRGEYMVRLYLIRGSLAVRATWRPAEGRRDDPLKMIDFAGTLGGERRVEWDPRRLDRLSDVTVTLEIEDARPFAASWIDERGKRISPPVRCRGPRARAELEAPLPFRPSGIRLPQAVPVRSITLEAERSYHRLPRRVDMAPRTARARHRPSPDEPACRIARGRVELTNATLRCTFLASDDRLRLASLRHELTRSEMLRRPDACSLFLVEVGGKRYAGSRDFRLRRVSPLADRKGFRAELRCEPVKLEADFAAWMDGGELRCALVLTNRADRPIDFKAAFPHLAGLCLSAEPADDYYFFPWGGGIISDAPAVIRRGYGDHAAIYQVMDVFSPARGAGLSIRCLDADGRYKVLALRKHVPGSAEINGDKADTPTADEYKWTNSLPAAGGVGVTYEYLRRTRKAGESFSPKPAALWPHAGDWHAAMKHYADWCHRVWRFRPHPSRLTGAVNMLAAGWGQNPLFRDGKYRTDFIRPRCDCIELMSWWEWSPLGPWRTPWDKLKQRLGEARYKRYRSYYVKDPVTGKTMYPINRGDYDGYNKRWGGLPALRKAIETYRKMGALVTLYTDPILACDNTRLGRKYGKLWGIVKPDGEYRTNYESWNMCHDVAAYRRYVAETMRRVMRQTGADGIRLDEYGHKGAACFNTKHEHTFAEWGCTEWQRAIAETTEMVREAMDEVAPRSVLTAEHPGYDYLMQFIDGCITYDLTAQATPLRPLECNLQRFYFDECKAYELDHRRADPLHRKRFWNAVGSFGNYYPAAMDAVLRENADAFESGRSTPLVETLRRFVYANRFEAKDKTLYTLYNATGHTVVGAVVRLDLGPDRHVAELLAFEPLAAAPSEDGSRAMSIALERDAVACVAVLPRRLRVRRAGDALTVHVRTPQKGASVCVCGADGQAVLRRPAAATVQFDLSALPKGAPKCVSIKLLAGGLLIDGVRVPRPTAPSR